MMRLVFSFIAGGLFGGGLFISGMTDTAKVQGWLVVFGASLGTDDMLDAEQLEHIALLARVQEEATPEDELAAVGGTNGHAADAVALDLSGDPLVLGQELQPSARDMGGE